MVMKKIILSLVLAAVSAAGYAQTEEQRATSKLTQEQKEARIAEIRSAYAEAKQKMSKNGKNGQSPRDLWIEYNDVLEAQADITEWEGT